MSTDRSWPIAEKRYSLQNVLADRFRRDTNLKLIHEMNEERLGLMSAGELTASNTVPSTALT